MVEKTTKEPILMVYKKLVRNSSTTAGAVRMVVAEVFLVEHEEGEKDNPSRPMHKLYPALALWHREVVTYGKCFHDEDGYKRAERSSCFTHKDYLRHGFRELHAFFETSCLIQHEDGLMPHDCEYLVGGCSDTKVVAFACPWPPEEDEDRLRDQLQVIGRDLLMGEACQRDRDTYEAAQRKAKSND